MKNEPRYGILYEKRRQRLKEDVRARLKGQTAKSFVASLKKAAEFAGDFTKLLAALSTLSAALGLLLLVAYLRSEGAPFPFVDASLIVFLILSAIAFVFLFFVLLSSLLLPAVVKPPPVSKLRTAFPVLFAEPACLNRQYLGDYLVFFSPFLFPLPVVIFFSFRDQLKDAIWGWASLLAIVLGQVFV